MALNEASKLDEVTADHLIIDDLDLGPAFVEPVLTAMAADPQLPAIQNEAIEPPSIVEPAFIYGSIDPEIASEAKLAAIRIRAKISSTIASIFEIGRDLKSIKLTLPHGEFSNWISAEFNMTARSAQNYMNAARLEAEECEIVSVLPPALIYKLTAPSTPVKVQKAIIAEINQGKVPTAHDVKCRISKEQEKHAAAEAANHLDTSRTPEQIEAWAAKANKREAALAKIAERARIGHEAIDLLTMWLGSEFPRFVDPYNQAPVEVGSALKNGKRAA